MKTATLKLKGLIERIRQNNESLFNQQARERPVRREVSVQLREEKEQAHTAKVVAYRKQVADMEESINQKRIAQRNNL